MPRFGTRSERFLEELHPKLVRLMREAIVHVDFSIREGHRPQRLQDRYFSENKTHVKWPMSKHNSVPSRAVHLLPYPWPADIDLDSRDARDRLHLFAGYVLAIALTNGVSLTWGGDWNHDWQTRDNNFDDLMHFELK